MDPINIQGLHNLCVVYVERGRLAKAHACLMHAHQLAPHEDYIVKHIQIVQTRLTKLKNQVENSKEKELAFSRYDPRDYGGPLTPVKIVKAAAKPSEKETSTRSTATETEPSQTDNQPVFIESTALP